LLLYKYLYNIVNKFCELLLCQVAYCLGIANKSCNVRIITARVVSDSWDSCKNCVTETSVVIGDEGKAAMKRGKRL